MPAEPVLELDGITKRFGALTANDGISLTLHQGEILALLGENGAGKTTLMNILFGHYLADEGRVEVFGEPLPPGSPRDAIAAGIGMVHQHFTLGENLTALDNIVLGTENLWSLRQHKRAARKRLAALSEQFGLAVHPDRLVGELSVGERQRVEILKALYRDARILILDEPTAVLTPQEVDALFATLKKMVADGLSIIFISHKLNEVMAIADRVAVLRQGAVVADFDISEASKETLAHRMVGREIAQPERTAINYGDPVLELRGVTVQGNHGKPLLDRLDLSVRAHEIVGIAGVSGNGQTALADVISGLVAPDDGELVIFEQAVESADPAAMVAKGVGRVPEDRHAVGSIGDMSVQENLILERYGAADFCAFGFLKSAAIKKNAADKIAGFDVRGAAPETPIRSLSGGNMQKVILARVLARAPRIILANQPTRGLDVGAAAYVQQLLFDARTAGAGIVLISEDLDELLQMSDRIAVIYHGRLTEPIPVEQASMTELGLLMSGHHHAT